MNNLIEDTYPLSHLQEGMLFHTLLAPGSGVYIEQMVCALHEDLNVSAFERAWQKVIARHPLMRTSFCWKDSDRPVQQVHFSVQCPMYQEDWRSLSENEKDIRWRTFLRKDRKQGFEMEKAPLMRLSLFHFSDANFRFVWTFHHILLDGRSFPIVIREVFSFYEALCRVEDIHIPSPRLYKDFVEWLEHHDLSKSEEYWQTLLQEFTIPTHLEVQKGEERRWRRDNESQTESLGHHTFRGWEYPDIHYLFDGQDRYFMQAITLSSDFTSEIKTWSRQHGISLYTIVQGVWAMLLSLYSGEDDVVFGAIRSCRRTALDGIGTDSIVGLFLNTLPVRICVPAEMPLIQWLNELTNQSVTIRHHEHIPLMRVQELSEIPRGMPLFDSVLEYERYRITPAMQSLGGQWKNRAFYTLVQTHFPITFLCRGDNDLILMIAYYRNRFTDAAIKQMLGHLQTLFKSFISARPEQPLMSLQMLTPEETQRIVIEWNTTQLSPLALSFSKRGGEFERRGRVEVDFITRFETQAEQKPDTPAVEFESGFLTYRQLNQRADCLAQKLKDAGIKQDGIAAIFADRSPETMIAVLAVLKSGGAYLSLDPSLPPERIAFMLEDSSAKILLTQKSLIPLTFKHQAEVIMIESSSQTHPPNPPSLWKREGGRGVSLRGGQVGRVGASLAYIIYTSGSTGKPKGVAMCRQALSNLILWQIQHPAFDSSLKTLQFSSLSFDVSFQEIFSTWCSGGTLVLVSDTLRRDAAALLRFLKEKNIGRLFLPFVALQQIAEAAEAFGIYPESLREVITAGEQLQITPAITGFFKKLGHCSLHNQYGPSETHVVTAHTLSASIEDWRTLPPIGRPIANTQIYVLDRFFHPAPVGVAGELCIGGLSLARGYLNRPSQTAEKFIPDPFIGIQGARLYRTGDIARYLSNGDIEFLGRADHQVKILGYRVELGEIEAAISRHSSVKKAVILPDQNHLTAYITLEPDKSLDIDELRDFLKTDLPEYMLPSALIIMKSFPITPSGKIDRLKLSDIKSPVFEKGGKFVAPRNAIERVIAGIWSEVLNIETIGINDKFLELGGNSILATRILSRIYKIFQVEIPMRALFDAPTISGIAKSLVKYETIPGNIERIAEVYDKIRSMSDEDIRALLHKKKEKFFSS